jgi:hypothetical protein
MYFLWIHDTRYAMTSYQVSFGIQGKSGRKAETQSHKAKALDPVLRAMLVEPPKVGSRAAARRLFIPRPASSKAYLLTKANPSKGGDAKLRD